MRSRLVLCVLGFLASACDAPPGPLPAPSPIAAQQQGVSDAERAALIAKGQADAERNSKVTRRSRQFTKDSL